MSCLSRSSVVIGVPPISRACSPRQTTTRPNIPQQDHQASRQHTYPATSTTTRLLSNSLSYLSPCCPRSLSHTPSPISATRSKESPVICLSPSHSLHIPIHRYTSPSHGRGRRAALVASGPLDGTKRHPLAPIYASWGILATSCRIFRYRPSIAPPMPPPNHPLPRSLTRSTSHTPRHTSPSHGEARYAAIAALLGVGRTTTPPSPSPSSWGI